MNKQNTKFKQSEIREIPEDWEVLTIDDVTDVVGGGTPSTKDLNNFGGDIPWITPKDLSNFPFRYIQKGERNITQKGLENSSAKLLPRGTVLLTTRAPVGYVAIADNEVTTNQGFRSLIPKKNVSSEFLYYLLKLNTEYLKSHASGTTFGELSGSTLKSLKFAFPKLSEQRAIASILSSLDDKVALNRSMNSTLEAIGRALFRRWFVDFEFPNEEGKPYRSSGGEMVYSEELDREIPKGWSITTLRELFPNDKECVITGPFGSNLHASDYREDGIPLILVKHVNRGRIIEDNLPLVGKHKLPELERYLLRNGDIIFTRVGAVGRSAYIFPRYVGWMISGQTLRVRINDRKKLNPRFLSQVYCEPSFIDMVESHALGTTRPSLNTEILAEFKFIYPPIEIQDMYAKLVNSLDNKIQNNISESRALAALRDSLLPKLMSGQIRVPVEVI